MSKRTEARGAEDDWTGVTSAVERRKLQNRLNQRRYRRARANPIRGYHPRPKPVTVATESPSSRKELEHKFRGLLLAVNAHASRSQCTESTSRNITSEGLAAQIRHLRIRDTDLGTLFTHFEQLMGRYILLGSPRIDLLLTLTQFNVFRALLSNTKSLGWDFQWLECEEPESPWIGSKTNLAELVCPDSLLPTCIQQAVPHHPWIDLWPIPRMRDNLLLADGLFDEDKLCNVLLEFEDIPNEKSGLVVWGEPWDPMSWEASESFIKDWAWAIKGCTELLVSTNHWRSQRGKMPVKW